MARERKSIAFLIALSICIFYAAGNFASAQSIEEFYKGNQLRVIVGSTTGGDYDQYARMIGRHITRHIPGKPGLVVNNMPGAGSLKATNYLYNIAPKDGSVIGLVSRSMPGAAVLKQPNVDFDPLKFNWLGSPEVNHLVLFINNSAPIKKLSDLRDREIVIGGTSPSQGITVGPVMLKNLLGLKLNIVTGYKSPAQLALAASRGEVQAFANTIGGASGARRAWVQSGQMRVLFNFEPEPVPGLDIPSIFDLVTTDRQRKALTFFASNVLLGRPILAPPGVPADRVGALKSALEQTFKDPAFLAEAKKGEFDLRPQSGEKVAALIADMVATPKDIIEIAQQAATIK